MPRESRVTGVAGLPEKVEALEGPGGNLAYVGRESQRSVEQPPPPPQELDLASFRHPGTVEQYVGKRCCRPVNVYRERLGLGRFESYFPLSTPSSDRVDGKLKLSRTLRDVARGRNALVDCGVVCVYRQRGSIRYYFLTVVYVNQKQGLTQDAALGDPSKHRVFR